ncbi:MAG: phenylacetate--CoA ligase [Bacteroidaceae bacterium]|nr:phenylacetate--CoA ligase [Bacteroidaceae bacterium]MBR4649019.1 phenylacetate--CoA ligase [Bacteroidaceae bacterium]MDO4951502.1 phenylacetate--CoA ligase [Bacteroidales bacterium]
MIHNPQMECMGREEMRALQSERLRKTVKTCYEKVPFYKRKMDELGVKPEDIKTVDDVTKLPFTTKYDLRDEYPFGLQAVPMSEVRRIHASSGTTGKPVVGTYTQNDLDMWAECVARVLAVGDVGPGDVVQVSYGYGLFTGGLGAHDGAAKLGAVQLPTSSGNSEKQIMLMQDLGTTALCCTPSYGLHLAEVIEKNKVPAENLKLRVGFFGAEPWTWGIRRELEAKLHIKAIDIYGLTEMCGPGVGGECLYQDGTHVWEDMFLPEIVDPETLEPVAPGEVGELVITSLCKEAMPILRYRTRDLTSLIYEPCKCGRTAVRMGKVLGRSDDMLIIRGVNVFPSQIETVLTEFPAFTPQYFITVDRKGNEDTFDLDVELREEFFSPNPGKQMPFIKPLYDRLVSLTGIKPNIHIQPPNTIQRSTGKAKHVNDKRDFRNWMEGK